jgi:hypothetical protein
MDPPGGPFSITFKIPPYLEPAAVEEVGASEFGALAVGGLGAELLGAVDVIGIEVDGTAVVVVAGAVVGADVEVWAPPPQALRIKAQTIRIAREIVTFFTKSSPHYFTSLP